MGGRFSRISHLMSGRLRLLVGLIGLAAVQVATPADAVGQVPGVASLPTIGPLETEDSAPGPLKIAGANAALSGVVAGTLQRVRGGSFLDGFVRGAAGGVLTFGGKQLVTADVAGAGFLGRQVAAVGTSVVQNAGEGIGSFDELVLPVWFVHIHRSANSEVPVRLRLDLVTTGLFVHGLFESSWRVDWSRSLSSGAPVFRASAYDPDRDRWVGNARAGVVIVRERDQRMIRSRRLEQAVFAHEFVHMVQHDQFAIGMGHTLQRGLLSRTRGGSWIDQRFDLGLQHVIAALSRQLFGDTHVDFLEREAHGVAQTGGLFDQGQGGTLGPAQADGVFGGHRRDIRSYGHR